MSNQRTTELSEAGVSIWLDDLSRARIDSGNLAEVIATANALRPTPLP